MKKILIIDDNPFFAESMKTFLDTKDYEIVSAENGVDGLKKVAEGKFDGILLDLMMPQMGGMEFLQELNKQYGKNKVPVIITSNLASVTKISEGISLGVRGYVIKSDESLQTIADNIKSTF